MRPLLAVVWVLAGCYLAHDRAVAVRGDGGAMTAPLADTSVRDSGPACRFSFVVTATGATADCVIDLSSAHGCTEAARCVCESGALTETMEGGVERCVEWETAPRGAITLSDFCTESPPARTTMIEAIAGYLAARGLSGVAISDECADLPALL